MGLEELKRLGIPVNTNNLKSNGAPPPKKMLTVRSFVPVYNNIEVEFEVPEGTDHNKIKDMAINKAVEEQPLTPWLVDEDRDVTAEIDGEEHIL